MDQYPVLEIGFALPTLKSKIRKNYINFDHCNLFFFGPTQISLVLRLWSLRSLISRTGLFMSMVELCQKFPNFAKNNGNVTSSDFSLKFYIILLIISILVIKLDHVNNANSSRDYQSGLIGHCAPGGQCGDWCR